MPAPLATTLKLAVPGVGSQAVAFNGWVVILGGSTTVTVAQLEVTGGVQVPLIITW